MTFVHWLVADVPWTRCIFFPSSLWSIELIFQTKLKKKWVGNRNALRFTSSLRCCVFISALFVQHSKIVMQLRSASHCCHVLRNWNFTGPLQWNKQHKHRPTNRTADQDLGLNAIPLSPVPEVGKKEFVFVSLHFVLCFSLSYSFGILDWQQRKITWKLWMWYTLKNVCKRTGRWRKERGRVGECSVNENTSVFNCTISEDAIVLKRVYC